MRRREFIRLVSGAAAAWPFTARAQQGDRIRRIGVLTGTRAEDAEIKARNAAFEQALQQLGWTQGRNVRIDYRFAGGDAATSRKQAEELVALAPDVIVSTGSFSTGQLLQVTHTVPVVFAIVPDPVGSGFVDSLSQPGGNATGFMQFEYGLSGKWLELLKEIAPSLTRAIVLWDPAITRRDRPVCDNSVCGHVGRRRCKTGQGARRGRDRARNHGLCTRPKWRVDRDGERVVYGPSRSDHRASGTA
jgi:putative ABC transport system substrate-binding protein